MAYPSDARNTCRVAAAETMVRDKLSEHLPLRYTSKAAQSQAYILHRMTTGGSDAEVQPPKSLTIARERRLFCVRANNSTKEPFFWKKQTTIKYGWRLPVQRCLERLSSQQTIRCCIFDWFFLTFKSSKRAAAVGRAFYARTVEHFTFYS